MGRALRAGDSESEHRASDSGSVTARVTSVSTVTVPPGWADCNRDRDRRRAGQRSPRAMPDAATFYVLSTGAGSAVAAAVRAVRVCHRSSWLGHWHARAQCCPGAAAASACVAPRPLPGQLQPEYRPDGSGPGRWTQPGALLAAH